MADDAVAIQDLLSIIANLQAINTTLQALQTIQPATLMNTQTGLAGAQVICTLTPLAAGGIVTICAWGNSK